MAGTKMVDTARVADIANEMEKLNNQLALSLEDVMSIMTTELPKAYSGDGSDEATKAFKDFYNKYANEYKELVEKYITYLRLNLGEEYIKVVSENKGLGDLFK